MANKQFNTYCRITNYLDATDPSLMTIIHGLCADGYFNPKGKNGITFLLPTDKAFRATLEKLAYSDKIEDADKARDMLAALVIRDVFKSPSDWKSREVANSLLPPQVVEVDSATAKEVVFKSGARAQIDEKFKDSSKKQNLAVWKLSGEIPVTTDRPAQNQQKRKKGSYDPGPLSQTTERHKIALVVENDYAMQYQSKKSHDVFCEYSLSLLKYIRDEHKDENTLLNVLPMLAFDQLDFYFLVEPHRKSGEFLLSDSIINGWWSQHRQLTGIECSKLIEELQQLKGKEGLVYTDRKRLIEKIASLRQKLFQSITSRPRDIVTELSKCYAELETENKIGGEGPVFPSYLAEFYRKNPGLKMLHDELRYVAHGRFKQLESDYSVHELGNLFNYIGECLHEDDSGRPSVMKILNANMVKYQIQPTQLIQEIKLFIGSTCFLHFFMPLNEALNIQSKYSLTRPDPNNPLLYNIAADVLVKHDRIIKSNNDKANDEILRALQSINLHVNHKELFDQLQSVLSK